MNGVIYCRVSTEEQAKEGYSLKAQEKACLSHASQLGVDIKKIFVEHGKSAKNTNRPELQNLLTYCTKHKADIDVIFIYKIDRLSRDMTDYTNLVVLLSKLGIAIRSVTEHFDDTAVG